MDCYFFKLIPETGPALYLDDEPIKWADVQIIGKRDPDWHGFNYEYTDGDVLLEFDCLTGKDFIDEIYEEQGVDGLILLQFGRIVGLSEIVEYEGKLNLATFKRLKFRIACSVEKNGIHDLVKSRWSTKVDLFSSNTLDGDAITPAQPLDLELHSKRLVNNFNKKTSLEGTTSGTPFLVKNLHDLYYTFNTQAGDSDDSNIDATPGTELGVSQLDPTAFSKYVFDLNAGGSFTFNITLNYIFNVKLIRKAISTEPRIGDWTHNHFLHIIDKNGTTRVKKSFTPAFSGYRNGQFLVTPGGYSVSTSLTNYQIELEEGDKVYIYAHFNFDGFNAGWKGLESYIQTSGTSFDIVAETLTPTSPTKALLIHEALESTLKIATGDENTLHSDFLGREDLGYPLDGCGSANMVTNGFQLRRFDTANRSPQISLKDILTSLNALYCIGMGYEGSSMRVEQREYFYNDSEILFIPEVSDFEETAATDLIFNNLKIGYSKYLDEGIRLLDEFNTEHEYLSPVRRHENQFSQLSTLIGSGYAIETTRRAQFSDTQKDSTKYDDDNFILAVRKDEPLEVSATFRALGDYFVISLTATRSFAKNETISVTGSIFNDNTYRIVRIFLGRIYVDKPLTNETATISITNLSRPYSTEKDEPFESVTGVVSPETSYNLRHSPKRMLMRWAKWLNGGFYYKTSGDLIKNTFVKQNGELTTQFNAAETCNLGDPQKDLITEKEDIALAEFDEFDKYFIPEWVTFKARMTRDEINTIRDAMTGQSVDSSYGFIRSIMPDGNHLESWIYEMTYNPNTEQVSFKCLKKRVIPIVDPDPLLCSDFSDITVGEAEALPLASQIFIEGCRFDNFTP